MRAFEQPTRYFIEYEADELINEQRKHRKDEEIDPANIIAEVEATTLDEARRLAPTMPTSIRAARIYERTGLHKVGRDGPVVFWEWDDEQLVEEITW